LNIPDIKSHEFYIEEFRPIGTDANNGASTAAASQTLPLFGQFCCRLAALPYCCETPGKTNVWDAKPNLLSFPC